MHFIWHVCKWYKTLQSQRSLSIRNGFLPPSLRVEKRASLGGCGQWWRHKGYLNAVGSEGLKGVAGTFQTHTPLFQAAEVVTPNGACFGPSIRAGHSEANPKSRTVTSKRQITRVRDHSYHRFWTILRFSDATVSKLWEGNSKGVRPKVWLKFLTELYWVQGSEVEEQMRGRPISTFFWRKS